MPWQRNGECNRCGSCCKGDPFAGAEGDPAEEGMCPIYRLLNGRGHCSDRAHPYYLNGCNIWPSRPEQLEQHPDCSYRFEWVA